jgi:hypothetical protein
MKAKFTRRIRELNKMNSKSLLKTYSYRLKRQIMRGIRINLNRIPKIIKR